MMATNNPPCHGVFECLQAGSRHWALNLMLRPWQKVHSYVVWHIENLGWTQGLESLCLKICRGKNATINVGHRQMTSTIEEALGLRSGELVEVKPIEEILATLDGNRRHRGLRWMTGMRKYCGRRLRVYKPVGRIMLETNGELRKMKNTVLLEGAMCDGVEFGACDRSCLHFWREAWLRRVPEGDSANPVPGGQTPGQCEV